MWRQPCVACFPTRCRRRGGKQPWLKSSVLMGSSFAIAAMWLPILTRRRAAAFWRHAEMAATLPVEKPAEDPWAVESGWAHPVDEALSMDESRRQHVADDSVFVEGGMASENRPCGGTPQLAGLWACVCPMSCMNSQRVLSPRHHEVHAQKAEHRAAAVAHRERFLSRGRLRNHQHLVQVRADDRMLSSDEVHDGFRPRVATADVGRGWNASLRWSGEKHSPRWREPSWTSQRRRRARDPVSPRGFRRRPRTEYAPRGCAR